MKQIDFIHKYKHLLPSQYRKDFERDLLSVFIEDEVSRNVIQDQWLGVRELKAYYEKKQVEEMKALIEQHNGQEDHFQTIMDIECKTLKEKE
jgi:hypothetical protein